MATPIFIVGTGRCGSTMLSNMIREHPKVLSLSEFFSILVDGGLRLAETFAKEPLGGEAFWDVVAYSGLFTGFAIRHGLPCSEWLYPYDDPAARFSAKTGVPALLVTSLPHLTEKFDELFEVLAGEVVSWPVAPIRLQYERLFAWLARHFGKTLWVERSGAGMAMLQPLMETFPDGRLVHIVRDGRDAALSMREHLLLRLSFYTAALERHIGARWPHTEDSTLIPQVEAQLDFLAAGKFDGQAFARHRLPLETCAKFWTLQVTGGLPLLDDLPPDRLLTLRYEDFFVEPKRQLDTLAAFLGDEFIDEDWSARCAALVRVPQSTWRDLPWDEARSLTEACRPGIEALANAGVHYDF